jgi:hypothetical protein
LDVGPCCWVGPNLCSACATLAELIASDEAGWPWLLGVLGAFIGDELDAMVEPEAVVEVPVLWRER